MKAVFLEGLTEAEVEPYKKLREALRNWIRPDDSDALSEFLLQQHRQDSLLLGAASRVDDLEILSAEEPDAMEAANPLKNGRVEFDETAVERREEAMVRKILSVPNPVSVLILGGDHDSSDNVPADVEYIRIGLEAGDR